MPHASLRKNPWIWPEIGLIITRSDSAQAGGTVGAEAVAHGQRGSRLTSNHPLRVLIATRCVVPVKPGHGGAEIAAYEQGRALEARGHEVTLIADAESEFRFPGRLELVPVESRLLRFLRRLHGGFTRWVLQHLIGNLHAALAVRRLTREREFDLVHAHGPLATLLISRWVNLPLVYTEHDAPPWQCRYRQWWERRVRNVIYRGLNVRAHRCADAAVAPFDSLGDEMEHRWGVQRVAVIPSAVDSDAFYPDASRRRAINGRNGNGRRTIESTERSGVERRRSQRRRYAFEHYCLFVGELCSRKAPDLLVRALAEAPAVCCVVVGDGAMRRHLQELAAVVGVEDRIAFLGRQSSENLARIYADADVMVLPSVSEASPLVVAEALSSGTPVIATRIAGIPSLVRDGETGFLVDPGDVAALADALRRAMGDERLRSAMAARARASVSETFAWSAIAGRHDELYRSLIPSDRDGRTTARRHEDARRDVPEPTPAGLETSGR